MKSFLETCRATEINNFVSLGGGKYDIRDGKRFLKLLVKETCKCNLPALTPVLKSNTPLHIDLDLRIKKTTTCPRIHDSVFMECAQQLLMILSSVIGNRKLKVVLTRRSGAYRKNLGEDIFASGFHIYISNVTLTNSQRVEFRTKCLADSFWYDVLVDGLGEGQQLVNPPEDVLDEAVGKTSSLIVIGCNKPNLRNKVSAHYIFYFDEWRNAWFGDYDKPLPFGWQFKSKNTLAEYTNCLRRIYKWIFKPTPTTDATDATPTTDVTPTKPECVPLQNKTNSMFNLEYFLEKCDSAKEDFTHSEWKQLVFYCRSSGMEERFVCERLNSFFKPKDRRENTRLWNAWKGVENITAGSIVRMISKYCSEWDTDTLFPVQQFLLYNEVLELSKGIHTFTDVCKQLKMFLVYVASDKLFAYRRRTFTLSQKGDTLIDTKLILDVVPPFIKSDDFNITLYPTLEKVMKTKRKLMREMKGEKAQKFGEEVAALLQSSKTDKQRYEKLLQKLGLKNEKQTVSGIIKTLHLDNQLRRYECCTFTPFSGKVPVTHDATLQLFTGFHLEKVCGNNTPVEETLLWKYFETVWAHDGKEPDQKEYIFDVLAHMIQFPRIRSERLYTLFSEEQGTGKSFMFEVFRALLGDKYCRFYDLMDTYVCRFNINNHSRLIHFLDDVESASEKQTRKLFPRVTCRTQQYEAKNQSIITLPEFSNIFITTNKKGGALFLRSQDRRQVILHAGDGFIQNRQFFKNLQDEVEDRKNMKSWYVFFKQRNLSNFNFQQDPKTKLKKEALMVQAPKSHKWLQNQFITHDFILSPHYRMGLCEIKQKNGFEIRAKVSLLYSLYTDYVRKFFPSSKIRNMDSWKEEILKMGAVFPNKRQRIFQKTYKVCDLNYENIKERFWQTYNIGMDWNVDVVLPNERTQHAV